MKLDPAKTALVFPGQGSQSVGMGRELAEQLPVASGLFQEADSILGIRLSALMWEGPEGALNETVNTQPALFVHSLAAYRAFSSAYPDWSPAAMAGHSLGELSALAAGGALSFEDGLRLVRRRGELMKRAGETRPGAMAAILNLDIPTLDQICKSASTLDEVVQVANDNCPGQVVISGAKPAIERALVLAKEAGARRAIPLAVSIAAHSDLMRTIQDDWDAAVAESRIGDSDASIVGNVSAQAMREAADLQQDIRLQMQSRVRWTETIQKLAAEGISTFVEVGSGTVLLGLIRRIEPTATTYPLGTPADLAALS